MTRMTPMVEVLTTRNTLKEDGGHQTLIGECKTPEREGDNTRHRDRGEQLVPAGEELSAYGPCNKWSTFLAPSGDVKCF